MIIASIADRSTYEFRGEDIARSSVTIAQQTDSIIQLGRSSYLLVGCLVRRCFYGTELVANVVMPILVSTEREVTPRHHVFDLGGIREMPRSATYSG